MKRSLARIPLNALLGNIREGRLKIIDSGGGVHRYGVGEGPAVSVRLRDPLLPFALLLNPSVAFGDAYMDGRLVVEAGTLRELIAILFRNRVGGAVSAGSASMRDAALTWLRRIRPGNDRRRAARNARHHYDLSGKHYDLFLDESRQYSCAYFGSGARTLEEAQAMKMALVTKKLVLSPGQRVLDVGCGWGGLACHIARSTGAQVTGITLSREQWKYAKARARKEGLEGRVTFLLQDYRETEGSFDRIVSVGMFEHVGTGHYGEFFRKLRSLLSAEGVALLHSIGRPHGPSYTDPWIRKHIFPGGYIPALSEVLPHAERAGFHVTDVEVLRSHYARTLREWARRFAGNRAMARELYGERFCRMWELYLLLSEASFEYLGNMVFQLQLATKPTLVPVTRDYLLEERPAKLKLVTAA